MSTLDAAEPTCPPPPPGLENVIVPRAHDIGGFEVRRALPARERQMVGPFIFFDQMGPAEFLTGEGIDALRDALDPARFLARRHRQPSPSTAL